MKRWLLSAFVLLLAGLASPAAAIELFTNFNNGTELGTRPYGIPEMPPVRYHWWQKNYCPPPEMQPPATMPRATAPSSMKLRSSGPAIVQPQSSSDGGTTDSEDERFGRSANFLPTGSGD